MANLNPPLNVCVETLTLPLNCKPTSIRISLVLSASLLYIISAAAHHFLGVRIFTCATTGDSCAANRFSKEGKRGHQLARYLAHQLSTLIALML